MNEALKAPQRAARLTLKLVADTRAELVAALMNIATAIDREQMTTGVSGGPSSGYIYEVEINKEPSHDAYFESVRAYLESLKPSHGAMQ